MYLLRILRLGGKLTLLALDLQLFLQRFLLC